MAQRQDDRRIGDVQRLDDRARGSARSMSTTTACSSRSFSLASSAGANRASSAGSVPRGADPAIATVSNDRPLVRTSRSGVAPRNVVPSADEGEGRAFRRGPRQVAQRRDDVEIGGRPEADAARQHDLVDPAAPDGAGEQADRPLPSRTIRALLDRSGAGAFAGLATCRSRLTARTGRAPRGRAAARPPRPRPVRDRRRGPRRARRSASRPRRVTPNVGSTSDEAPNDAHGSSPVGCAPLNPRPPSRTGPRRRHVAGAPSSDGIGQDLAPGSAASAKRPGPPPRPPTPARRRRSSGPGGRLEPERRLEVQRARRPRTARSDRSGRRSLDGQRVAVPGAADGQPARRRAAARSRPASTAASSALARRSTTVTASWPSGRRSALRRRRRSGAAAPAASGRPFERLGIVDQQPARDDLVERPEPRDAGQPVSIGGIVPAATASSR